MARADRASLSTRRGGERFTGMETRLTLRPGQPGTRKLVARYGERLVRVRYLYDAATRDVLQVVPATPANGNTMF